MEYGTCMYTTNLVELYDGSALVLVLKALRSPGQQTVIWQATLFTSDAYSALVEKHIKKSAVLLTASSLGGSTPF